MALPVERPLGKTYVHRSAFAGAIEFQDLSFNYPGHATEALSKVSFFHTARRACWYHWTHRLWKNYYRKGLFSDLYEPTAGAVRIDGTDIRQIDPAALRRNIGYVPQDVMLFYGSLRDNIVRGAPYVDDSAVLKAAEIARDY